jgi:hypothetical protein
MNSKKPAFSGKAVTVLCTAIILTSLSFSSCKKDNAKNTAAASGTVTEQDAARATIDAVDPTTGGMVSQLNSSVAVFTTATIPCSVKKDTTITGSSISGVTPSFTYSLSWNYLFDCSAQSLTFNFSGNSSYSGVILSSSGTSSGGFVMTGLLPDTSQYTFNTTYTRTGTTSLNTGKKVTFTSDVEITSSNIIIDKTTQEIVSGSATVTVSGASTTGNSYNFAGTITFSGDKKGSLVLNSGTSYALSW